jgi:tetratricopeptide (TPR) repeat protein
MIARARYGHSLTGIAAAVVLGFALVLGGVLATREPDHGPLTDDRVVAVLPAAKPYSGELQARLRAARANPDDPAAAKEAARRLIDEGREAGDARLVGAALGVLRPHLAADAEALFLAATARQYQHDFAGARGLLDRALALSPRDPAALLSRATIGVVTGRLDTAGEDCRTLLTLRLDLGVLCQAMALAPTTEAPAAYGRLAAVLERTDVLDGSLRGYALGLMGEIAALQGRRELARTHFAAALADDPGALRVRIMLADVLLADGDATAALGLLAEAPGVDAVLLRRAIAAQALGRTAVLEPVREELSRRFRQNLDLGLVAHAREEARYYLEVERDPVLALGRAVANWGLQRDVEDAQLLIDTAMAAGSPAAAAPVLRWMTEQAVSVPALRVPDAVRAAAR